MLTKLDKIIADVPAIVYAFDVGNRLLYNLGGMEAGTLKSASEVATLELMDGVLHQLSVTGSWEMMLAETSGANLSLWDGAHDTGASVWIVGAKETFVIRSADYTLGWMGTHDRKKANTVPLKIGKGAKKVTDLMLKMKGYFDPTGLILLLNPALQKNVGDTKIIDCSNFERTPVMNGMTTSVWSADGVSLTFDGINDYLSVADSEFKGPEMIGSVDANNRTFASGIGNWAKQNANDTFASVAGGVSGNGGKLTIGASASSNLLKLSSDIKSLVVGQSYHLQLSTKYENAWAGGYLQIAIGGANERIVVTNAYQTFSFDFIASNTNPEIVITSASTPSAAGSNVLWIDEVSLTLSSDANLNCGEMVLSSNNRGFEQNTAGDWTGNGNHSVAAVADPYQGSYALRVIASGAGSQTTDYVALATSKFIPLVAGKTYTVEMFLKRGDNGVSGVVGFGASGQTKTFTGLTTANYVKCVWNFVAGANDVGVDFRYWNNVSSPTNGMRIDSISITEAKDATLVAWVKRNGNPASLDEMIIAKWLASNATYAMSFKAGSNKLYGLVQGDVASIALEGNTTVITDAAYHLCVVSLSRTGNMQLYVDAGVDNGATSIQLLGKIITTQPVTVGSDGAGSRWFNGQLGAVELLRGKAWSQQEVIDFYQSTRGVYGV